MLKHKGFTLVEIMIAVAIITLLAGLAIPGFTRIKIISNDSAAKSALKAHSTAAEMYANIQAGTYPSNITSLTSASPPYLSNTYCGTDFSGFSFTCVMSSGSYTFTASPVTLGSTGTTTYTISTGGIWAE